MAKSSKDTQLIELKDTITELNKLIKTLQETLASTQKLLEDTARDRDNYKEQTEYLKKKLFGASSEKRDHSVDGQLSLFNELELEADLNAAAEEAAAIAEELEATPKSKKKRSTNQERFKGIPVKKVELEPDSKVCPDCGTELVRIGTELVRRELEYTPAKFNVVEYYSVNYKCPSCESEKETPVIIKGKDGKAHMLHGLASASTIAWVIYQKYVNSIPLYRQEKDWQQYGVTYTRATFSFWVIKNTDAFLKPFYEYLHDRLLERETLMADETPTQVLKEPERRAETKSYMWLFRTGEDGGNPIVLYKYSQTRAGETAENFLRSFDGYLMCDGYSGYNKVPNATRLSCWAHVRRYLIDSIPNGKQYDYQLPAVQGVLYIDKLFNLDKKIKNRCKTYEEIRKARLEEETPILTGFWSWFDQLKPQKNSKLDKAVTYIRNRRPYLEVYLEDGRLSLSNNLSENSIRPFTVGRKNWLFSDTPAGADASSVIYSIVETAKANDVNVYHYIAFLLEKLSATELKEFDFESVCPWNQDVKNEVQQRVNKANEA